jgi:hypothetical protein
MCTHTCVHTSTYHTYLLQVLRDDYWIHDPDNPEVSKWRDSVQQYIDSQTFKDRWGLLKVQVSMVGRGGGSHMHA